MTQTPLERLHYFSQRHDTAMPDGLIYPQTPAERARDCALTNLRLAADFVRIATEMMEAGQTYTANYIANARIQSALYHLNLALAATQQQPETPSPGRDDLPPGPRSMLALGDTIMGKESDK